MFLNRERVEYYRCLQLSLWLFQRDGTSRSIRHNPLRSNLLPQFYRYSERGMAADECQFSGSRWLDTRYKLENWSKSFAMAAKLCIKHFYLYGRNTVHSTVRSTKSTTPHNPINPQQELHIELVLYGQGSYIMGWLLICAHAAVIQFVVGHYFGQKLSLTQFPRHLKHTYCEPHIVAKTDEANKLNDDWNGKEHLPAWFLVFCTKLLCAMGEWVNSNSITHTQRVWLVHALHGIIRYIV